MMVKRTTEQWLALFEAHQKSDLSQAQFCQEQGLCPKYFSVRRRQLRGIGEQKPFVRVRRIESKAMTSDVDWQLQVGEIKVRAVNASVDQMLGLIKGLM